VGRTLFAAFHFMPIYAVDGQAERKTTSAKSRKTTVGPGMYSRVYFSICDMALIYAMSVLNSGKIGTRRGVKMLDSTQEEYNPIAGSGMCSIGRTTKSL
jgi:hypothetical protein